MHDMLLGPSADTLPSNSQSQDNVYSQASVRGLERDSGSSYEVSLSCASHSEMGSIRALGTRDINLLQAGSKSLDALPIVSHSGQDTLYRCHSDSLLKYNLSSDYGFKHLEGRAGPRANQCPLIWGDSWSASQSDSMHDMPSDCGSDSTANSESHEVSCKQTGLTVTKMQKWMYKGRLLSLEMKERITGSSQRAGGSCKLASNRTDGSEYDTQTVSGPVKMPGEMARPPLTDLIENIYTSSIIRRDITVTEENEQNLQKNLITVSKKKNWLTQNTPQYPSRGETFPSQTRNTKDRLSPLLNVGAESLSRSPELSIENPATPMPVCEDNDADDEGEIWYNPIPEDDDSYPCNKPVCGVPVSLSCESRPVDSLHSLDYGLQPPKLRAVCRASTEQPVQEIPTDAGSGVPSTSKSMSASGTEFSPPSSPNPSKKGSSISWSLPDKIKSPRTVRKLSMKMKKLPELSRKLSVRGTSSSAGSDHTASVSKGDVLRESHTSALPSPGNSTAASRNVISRYHLDSSVSSQQNYRKKRCDSSNSSSKGGYLSDGDSPELIAKSGKHISESRSAKGKEVLPISSVKNEIDIDAFRHYSFSDQPKCFHYISGLMSAHFYGAEDLKPPRIDSKDVFCAIQVDSVNKARTALLTCRTTFLDMDHTFNIELENAQHLKLVVFSWDPAPKKNRVCCHGTVVLPSLFRVIKTHQLAVKLEPRGLIYVKLNLMEQWDNSLDRLGVDREPIIFGVEARKVVEKENAGLKVPLLMNKCITEIEKRGCQVVGLYRLCGSAAVKKELREAFEKDSKAVALCENEYPDINVITGVLKDYLRELPSPLITKQLYEAVLKAMAAKPLKITGNGCENGSQDSDEAVGLLNCLPEVERATLKMLLDHLKLVASHHEVNKMTCQNLAVCFGPVLLSQHQETSIHNNRVFIDSEELASALDFKKHIEVLHYLLQLWPGDSGLSTFLAMFVNNIPTIGQNKQCVLFATGIQQS
ncbi:rho GTPase-activating SYDE2 [Pelobates cultripes]|uniref:Rho GTPase-activating SYDE2 n=1 Tax=Pelobates cultripes TaxID=61616 RepID=A0AAD1SRK5_PELCU|nr:rho GTPase-activating SYDE2 [Pelobates cultripes]